MLKKSKLATVEQHFSDLLLQRKVTPLVSTKPMPDLSRLQRQVLDEIVHHSASGNYLSMRDLGKMLPHKRSEINDALVCLQDLGLIYCVRAEGIIYYSSSEKFSTLKKQVRALAIYSKIERKIINIIRESLMRLYPFALASDSEGFLGSGDTTPFDILFKFNSIVMGNQFFVADVFTKIPVDEQIVHSFNKKISLAYIKSTQRSREDINRRYPLGRKALGMLICNTASQKAIETAKDHDISLLRFRDISLCYSQVHRLINLIPVCSNKNPENC